MAGKAMSPKERYASDPAYRARVLAYNKEYRERNRAAISDRKRAYAKRTAAYIGVRERVRKYGRFGLTESGYYEMLTAQDNRCAICEAKPKNDGLRECLYVDHDHSTGRIRSLLCKSCNSAIGLLGDSPDLADRAGSYLRGWKIRHSGEVVPVDTQLSLVLSCKKEMEA